MPGLIAQRVPHTPPLRVGIFSEDPERPLLQNLKDYRRRGLRRFANQQMHMIRHDHISHQEELVALPDFSQSLDKPVAARTVPSRGSLR